MNEQKWMPKIVLENKIQEQDHNTTDLQIYDGCQKQNPKHELNQVMPI